jgi:hypothetical protein
MVGTYNISIVQGSDTNDLKVTPKQSDGSPRVLLNYTARLQIRRFKDKNSTLFDDLSTENARLVIDTEEVGGETFYFISVKFPSGTTNNYCFDSAYYDLEVYSPDATPLVRRLIEGTVSINKEVTRE